MTQNLWITSYLITPWRKKYVDWFVPRKHQNPCRHVLIFDRTNYLLLKLNLLYIFLLYIFQICTQYTKFIRIQKICIIHNMYIKSSFLYQMFRIVQQINNEILLTKFLSIFTTDIHKKWSNSRTILRWFDSVS